MSWIYELDEHGKYGSFLKDYFDKILTINEKDRQFLNLDSTQKFVTWLIKQANINNILEYSRISEKEIKENQITLYRYEIEDNKPVIKEKKYDKIKLIERDTNSLNIYIQYESGVKCYYKKIDDSNYIIHRDFDSPAFKVKTDLYRIRIYCHNGFVYRPYFDPITKNALPSCIINIKLETDSNNYQTKMYWTNQWGMKHNYNGKTEIKEDQPIDLKNESNVPAYICYNWKTLNEEIYFEKGIGYQMWYHPWCIECDKDSTDRIILRNQTFIADILEREKQEYLSYIPSDLFIH